MTVDATIDHATLDATVADLRAHAGEWTALAFAARRWRCWTGCARGCWPRPRRWWPRRQRAKGIDPATPWGAEDWLAGPVGVPAGRHQPADDAAPGRARRAAGADVGGPAAPPTARPWSRSSPPPPPTRCCSTATAPRSGCCRASRPSTAVDGAAAMYRGQGYADPGVTLVLGAGNVGAITTLDILHMLYTEGSVCVVKMNPVNDYLSPYFSRIFGEFVERGWLRFVHGGADVGAYLAHHDGIDSVHMTGSAATHDAIVWGIGAEAADAQARRHPAADEADHLRARRRSRR